MPSTDRRCKSAKNAALFLPVLVLLGVCAALWAPLAAAAPAPVGLLGEPTQDCAVAPFNGAIFTQANYTVPVDGVIIEWRFESGAEVPDPETKLMVLRQEGSKYKAIGATTLGAVAKETVSVVPANISVVAGDILGLYTPPSAGGDCLFNEVGAPTQQIISGDLQVGEAEEPSTSETGKRLSVAAIVLPPPVISRLEPSTVVFDREDDVTVIGENFEQVQSVTLGGNAVSFTRVSDKELKFVTPREPAGELPVRVTTPAGTTAVTKESTLGFGPPLGSPDGSTGTGLINLGPPAPTTAPPSSQPTPICTVPRLKGRKLKDAKQAIRTAGCAVGKVTAAKHGGALKPKVASQQPPPGKQLPPGAKVAIKLG